MSDHLIDEVADDLNAQSGLAPRYKRDNNKDNWIELLIIMLSCGSAALVVLGIKTFCIWMGSK